MRLLSASTTGAAIVTLACAVAPVPAAAFDFFGNQNLPPAIVEPPAVAPFARPRVRKFKRPRLEAEADRVARKSPAPAALKGPLLISISLDHQRLKLYDDGVVIAESPVSTGMPGHPTPLGVFSVIQKDRFHRSNIYSAAPMPFMQRITWSGVALHAGVVPGYPASHGCIRLPSGFAVRLWGTTKLGARVIIARGEVAPVDFADPHLFVKKERPLDVPVATPAPGAPGTVKVEDKAALDPASTEAKLSPAVPSKDVAPGQNSGQSKASAEPAQTEANPVAPAAVPMGPAAPPSSGPAVGKDAASERPAGTAGAEPDSKAPPAIASPTGEDSLEVIKIQGGSEILPHIDLRTTLDSVKADATPKIRLAQAGKTPIIISAPEIAPGRRAPSEATEVYGPPRPLRAGPISVFISKKEGRLFVRKGFEPIFDAPIKITGDGPLGTHVFTATNFLEDKSTLRWNVVTMPMPPAVKMVAVQTPRGKRMREEYSHERPPSPSSASVLARLVLPQEAVDRIQELIGPGASVTVSDQGLGPETGRETDFIVLTR
jgi:lipoprotein-anchoring transpeptidase ErfK/SrfK